jgi:hypothetical protein
LIDDTEAGEGGEATVGTGDDSLATHDIDKSFYALCDEEWVLDKISDGIENSGHEDFIVGYR